MSRPSSIASSASHSSRPVNHSETSSSKHTSQLNSSLVRTAAALSPATTDRTSLLSPKIDQILPPEIGSPKYSRLHSQCSEKSSILFSLQDQDQDQEQEQEQEQEHHRDPMPATHLPLSDRLSRGPSLPFDLATDEQSIQDLLTTLGYSQASSPSPSRAPLLMQDIHGQAFSIHEHSLSPVSERTELDTTSSKTSHSKKRPLVQNVLAHRFQSEHGLSPITPLKLTHYPRSPSSPIPSLKSNAKSDHPTQLLSPPGTANSYPGRPSIHRIPKKTSQLIRLFENTSSTQRPAPTNLPSNSNNPSSPHASPHQLPSPARTRALPQQSPAGSPLTSFRGTPPHSSPQSPATRSVHSWNSTTIPEPSMSEQECLRARQERRERIAMASKHTPAYSTLPAPSASHTTMLEPPSPMSDQYLKHRKSVASSITSKISDIQVLHSGAIWYRNPQTNQWKETRGILTTEAVYLMNENGKVDQNLPDQSIELNLRGCISVESVRSKRSYGPEFTEPHLHILRIAWAEFDPQSNSRREYEEFLGCSRATQRADWVGAIWQAAHDLGGFVDQPDIPLRRDVSPTSVQPSPNQPKLKFVDSNHPRPTPSASSAQASSPRLDPISLVDRTVSIHPVEPRHALPVAIASSPTSQFEHSSSQQLEPPAASLISSRTSESGSITTNLQSELDRELLEVQQAVNPPALPSTRHLYSNETLQEIRDVDLALRSYPIDPNLERKSTRPPSPELDIFAMLDRMSVSGSIHRNTAQFYDPPSSQNPRTLQGASRCSSNGAPGHADRLALDQDTHDRRRSPSQHSYHTIRPTSAAGIHDQHVDSPRPSALGLRPIDREHLSEVVSTTKLDRSQSPNLSVSSFQKTPLAARLSSPTTPKAPYNQGLLEPMHGGGRARGAWSDTDRLSNQTDNILTGSNPARAVQRDLRRILKTIERNDSHQVSQSQSLGNNLDSIQTQLQNVAAKLRGHPLERESHSLGNENDEPTIADKVDYMLSLCNILLESQHKVSSAVEKNLRAHGVSISNRSARTRSIKSSANPSRRSSYVSVEPGMPGPAPLTPLAENNLDPDRSLSPTQSASPPLPPVPDSVESQGSSINAQESGPPEPLPPVAVQEAGLSRIENLLVALLSRMDESAQRQQQEPPPPVPEKDTTDGHLVYSHRLSIGAECQSESPDLDADVALWKSGGQDGAVSDRLGGTLSDQQSNRSGHTSHPPSVCPSTEQETSSTAPDHFSQQNIPDYNLAYEAEDEVARRIADERARAARRLEGTSTPFNCRYSFGQNGFPGLVNAQVTNPLHEPAPQVIPPNQDHHDPPGRSSRSVAGLSSVSVPPQKSYWSPTTPTAEDQDDSTPPPPPPKDDQIGSQAFSQPPPSIKAPSRAPSSSAVSRRSIAASDQSNTQSPQPSAHNPPSHSQILPEIRNVVQEALQQHSTEQAPVLDEVVTLLRTQDQVSQASIVNQAEVSRYLGQLNVHLEGVLHKKNEEILQIGENVGRLEKQLAFLVEQSEKISSSLPLIDAATSALPPLPPEHAPTSIDQPQEEVNNDVDHDDRLQIDPDAGLDYPPVDVSIHPQEDDGLDPTGEEHVTLLSNKPSVGYKINGPRARKISFGKRGLKGPRLPAGLTSVGKLWGGPVPVADRASRWGTTSVGGGGSLKRVPTKTSQFGGGSDHLTHVEGVLAQVNPEDPVGQQALSQMDAADEDRSGTIALGVSHILKFLRENAEKEELRRQKKEAEKANAPKPAIPDEMEQRRAKIEELQLRREATLAEDKAKHLEAMMQAMKQQAIEHDKLLKKIAEEIENKKLDNYQQEEDERKKNYQDALDGVNKVLTTVESGVMSQMEDFKCQMMNEMKQTFEKVGELREQKQQLQADIADMLAFMSKVKGGAPDPRWQHPPQMPPHIFRGGTGNEGSIAGLNYPQHLAPIPETYHMPQTDFLDRDNPSEINAARSVSGFGPRPPGPR